MNGILACTRSASHHAKLELFLDEMFGRKRGESTEHEEMKGDFDNSPMICVMCRWLLVIASIHLNLKLLLDT